MESVTEMSKAFRRARVAYEWGRARRAFLGFLPIFVLVGAVSLLGDQPRWTLAFGIVLFALGVVMLWYGREPKRAVLPGLAAGVVPLVLVLCARQVGHFCTGTSCTSLCIQACAVGGILAGLAVARVGHSRNGGLGFWVAASSVAILTGAMACSCLGISGIAGLALGYAAGTVPVLLGRAFAKKSS